MLDDEILRALRLLEVLIQAAGSSEEEMERRLGASQGYLGRLLSGGVELKLRHILSILQVLEIEPAQYFQSLYPSAPAASPAIQPGAIEMDALDRRLRGLGLGEPPPEDDEG